MGNVSIIITVYNEEKHITELLTSLFSQTKKPEEIIIIDAFSKDKTWEILKEYAKKNKSLKIFQKAGIRSIGRNEAIRKAKGEIIAITDAGCVPEKNWLHELIKPFSDKKVEVVSGYYKAIAKTNFEKCETPYVLVMPDKINDEFFPSTRSMAMRKIVWQVYGGFDEKIDPSEDYEFAVRLHRRNVKFFFAKEAVVGWYPRHTLSETAWMFLQFAAGDVIADVMRPKIKWLALRYLVFFYLFFIAVQIPQLFSLWLGLAGLYLLWSIKKNYKYCNTLTAFYWLPILQVTADICVLVGTMIGFLYKMGSPKKNT